MRPDAALMPPAILSDSIGFRTIPESFTGKVLVVKLAQAAEFAMADLHICPSKESPDTTQCVARMLPRQPGVEINPCIFLCRRVGCLLQAGPCQLHECTSSTLRDSSLNVVQCRNSSS